MKNLFDVSGKVAVVTGGSRGIGAMIARGFVENGVKTYITSRKEAELRATADELSALGECIAIPADLSTVAGVTAFADAVKADEDKLHARSCIDAIGFPMARACADEVYAMAGRGPSDVNVVELHDCFSCNELITYEALRLCDEGEGGRLVERGDCTYGGKYVVNPSGGLISKGHPLGATGGCLVSTVLDELERRDAKRAMLSLCVGGGMGISTIIERV